MPAAVCQMDVCSPSMMPMNAAIPYPAGETEIGPGQPTTNQEWATSAGWDWSFEGFHLSPYQDKKIGLRKMKWEE